MYTEVMGRREFKEEFRTVFTVRLRFLPFIPDFAIVGMSPARSFGFRILCQKVHRLVVEGSKN